MHALSRCYMETLTKSMLLSFMFVAFRYFPHLLHAPHSMSHNNEGTLTQTRTHTHTCTCTRTPTHTCLCAWLYIITSLLHTSVVALSQTYEAAWLHVVHLSCIFVLFLRKTDSATSASLYATFPPLENLPSSCWKRRI